MSVSETVRQLEEKRKLLGLSRAIIARLLNVSEASYSRWITKIHRPSTYYSRQISKLLKIIEEIEAEGHKE